MSPTQLLLAAFDESFSHQWESIEHALHGLSDAEATWQHPAYVNEVESALDPPPGTVVWHIAHLDHCLRHYRNVLKARPLDTEPETLPPPLGSLHQHIASLHEAREALRDAIAGLTDDDLAEKCRQTMSVAEFVRMFTRHNTWHAGQIMVLRRAYKHAIAPAVD